MRVRAVLLAAALATPVTAGAARAEILVAVAGPMSVAPATAQYARFGEELQRGADLAVRDANERLILLYKVTAHVLLLNAGTNDGNGNVTTPQGIVGRIDSATEGSVNVSAQYNSVITESEAFFIQTQYGAQFWQMTAPYRTALYIPPPAFGPNGPGLEAFFGFNGEVSW